MAELSAENQPQKRASIQTSSETSPPTVPSTIDEETLDEVVRYVKKRRTANVQEHEKLDILLLQAKLRHEHHQVVAKSPQGRRTKAAKVTLRVSQLLNRKKQLVGEVLADYWRGLEQQASTVAANYAAKATVIPRLNVIATAVQTFVRMRRCTRKRTTAKDVLDLLVQLGFMRVNTASTVKQASSLRCVRRYLKELRFKRGKKRTGGCYRLRDNVRQQRDAYISFMTALYDSNVNARRVVYMDESYVNHNYARHDDSLFDPNDEQDLAVAVRHKGRRYCFIAAIIDSDRSVDEDKRTDAQKAQLMDETLDIFVGGKKKKGKKQTKDYHGMFDGLYFEEWMAKLIKALEERQIQNAVIVLDNAKYHKRLPEDTPKGSASKAVMLAKCKEYGLSVQDHELKGAIWGKLKVYIEVNIQPTIVQMAAAAGHMVLFSPPHHSDLQPIETVWAIVKGYVGRLYTTETSFQDVLLRLQQAFKDLKASTVDGCIRKANTVLKALYHELRAYEDANETDSHSPDDSDTSSSESDSSSSDENEDS